MRFAKRLSKVVLLKIFSPHIHHSPPQELLLELVGLGLIGTTQLEAAPARDEPLCRLGLRLTRAEQREVDGAGEAAAARLEEVEDVAQEAKRREALPRLRRGRHLPLGARDGAMGVAGALAWRSACVRGSGACGACDVERAYASA